MGMGSLFHFGRKHFRLSGVLLAVTVLGLGCEKQLDISTLPSFQPTGVTPVGSVSNSGFYVEAKVPNSNVSYYMHEQSTFTPSTCTIAQNEAVAANRDILCIMDIAELDLYFGGYSLNFNAPPSMCEYVEATGYNYKLEVGGNGPTAVTVCRTDDAAATALGITSQVPAAVLNVVPSITMDQAGTLTCAWNYSTLNGPNCCGGSYSLTTVFSATGIAGCAAPTRTVPGGIQSWGGSAGACLEGPGTYDPKSPESKGPTGANGSATTGYIYDTSGVGLNTEWKVASGLKLGKNANIFGSGYYTPLNPAAAPTAYNQPWTFACRDSAYDIVARIRVYTRSWDNLAGFLAKTIDSTNPATLEALYNEEVHDFALWSDIGNNFPLRGYSFQGFTYFSD